MKALLLPVATIHNPKTKQLEPAFIMAQNVRAKNSFRAKLLSDPTPLNEKWVSIHNEDIRVLHPSLVLNEDNSNLLRSIPADSHFRNFWF